MEEIKRKACTMIFTRFSFNLPIVSVSQIKQSDSKVRRAERERECWCAVITNASGMQSDKMWKHPDGVCLKFYFHHVFRGQKQGGVCVCVYVCFPNVLWLVKISSNNTGFISNLLICPFFTPSPNIQTLNRSISLLKFEYKYFLNIFTNVLCFFSSFFLSSLCHFPPTASKIEHEGEKSDTQTLAKKM